MLADFNTLPALSLVRSRHARSQGGSLCQPLLMPANTRRPLAKSCPSIPRMHDSGDILRLKQWGSSVMIRWDSVNLLSASQWSINHCSPED